MSKVNEVGGYPYPMPPRIAPQYNAVKIEIHNPEVNAQRHERKDSCCTCPIYDYPKQAIYDVPKAQIYEEKSQETVQKVQVPPPVVIQQPVVRAEKEPESIFKQAPIKTETPEVKETKPAEPQLKAAEAKTTEVKSPEPEPKAIEAEPKKIKIEKPEDIKPVLDLNKFLDALTNKNYNIQAKAMQEATQLAQLAPEMAVDLLDVKVVDTLLNLINQSNGNLAGPTARQVEIRDRIMKGQSVSDAELNEANARSPLELAERNKQYAMYTVAALDKIYINEVEKLTGGKPPITELPGAADIVEQIKTSENPMVRIAAIKALDYIKNPDYKEDLKAIYSIAVTDPDPIVQKMAQAAIQRLEK